MHKVELKLYQSQVIINQVKTLDFPGSQYTIINSN